MSNQVAPETHKTQNTEAEYILNITEVLRIVRFSWQYILGIVVIFLSIALVLALTLPKKWEASVTLRIAQVPSESGTLSESNEFKVIENPLQTVERMKLIGFKEEVLNKMQLPTEKGIDKRTDIILNSLKSSVIKNTDFINLSVRGYSKKDVITTIQVATKELQTVHAQMTLPFRNRISHELQATNKNLSTTILDLTLLKSQMAKAGTYKSTSEFAPSIIAIDLLTTTEETRRTLELQQIQLKDRLVAIDEQSTALVSSINMPKKPIFPQLSGFLVLGGFLGMLAGIVMAVKKNKKRSIPL